MKKTIIIITILLVLVSSALFLGCANQVLYGSWKLSETIDANTMQAQDASESMFSNVLIFKINRDKTVTFLDKEFGTFTKSGNEFTFAYTATEGEQAQIETGAWELNGVNLRIWIDSAPMIYDFVRVEMNGQ